MIQQLMWEKIIQIVKRFGVGEGGRRWIFPPANAFRWKKFVSRQGSSGQL